MKRLTLFAPLLLLAALLLSPAAALAGARQGLALWQAHVFPALLPSFICLKLAQELGLLHLTAPCPKGRLAVAAGFSLVAGAPNGAKLLYGLVQDGCLPQKEGEKLLPLVNSVSPMFLLSIIASELLKNKGLFRPMGLAFYGVILCLAIPRLFRKNPVIASACERKAVPFSAAFSAAVESSMLDMLRVGGCILFSCTLLSLIAPLLPGKGAYAALAGFLEVSTGASVLTSLTLPMRLKTSLMIGAAAFGGLSLALQSVCCYPGLKLFPYILRKLLLGSVVGLVSYLLFPLFPDISAVFAGRQEALQRSLSLSALLLSSLLSLAFMSVLSLMIGHCGTRGSKETCKE